MKKVKNIVIVILLLVLGIILFYGLKTWSNDGKDKAASEVKTTTSVQKQDTSVPTITITSTNTFDQNNVTNSDVSLSFKASNLKDVYINGQSINDAQSTEKITEAIVTSPGAYEVIIEDSSGSKAIIKFSIDPGVVMPTEGSKNASEIKSEAYTGEIKAVPQGPIIKAQVPSSLTNGGTVAVEFVTLDYTSTNTIQSVTLDGERMEITGSVTTYVSGKHTVVVTDTTGASSTFTFTNNY
ncbi:MAG: hypothetical protein RR579_09975 [Eubacterium sp.]